MVVDPQSVVVFITVQNLVGITSVNLIIQKFDFFAHWLANTCLCPYGDVLGIKIGKDGNLLHFISLGINNPKLTSYEANW